MKIQYQKPGTEFFVLIVSLALVWLAASGKLVPAIQALKGQNPDYTAQAVKESGGKQTGQIGPFPVYNYGPKPFKNPVTGQEQQGALHRPVNNSVSDAIMNFINGTIDRIKSLFGK